MLAFMDEVTADNGSITVDLRISRVTRGTEGGLWTDWLRYAR
jgi:hypothetical protein